MKTRIQPPDQFVRQLWKNGGGSTLELARFPANSTEYHARISIADVKESGPFSSFTGYQRTIIQLEGPPMTLSHADTKQSRTLKLYEPYHFDGNWSTSCELKGSAKDFNVITRDEHVISQVSFQELQPDTDISIPISGNHVLIYGLAGKLTLESEKISAAAELSEGHLCTISEAGAVSRLKIRSGGELSRFIVTQLTWALK